jgi:hypothetical protein
VGRTPWSGYSDAFSAEADGASAAVQGTALPGVRSIFRGRDQRFDARSKTRRYDHRDAAGKPVPIVDSNGRSGAAADLVRPGEHAIGKDIYFVR